MERAVSYLPPTPADELETPLKGGSGEPVAVLDPALVSNVPPAAKAQHSSARILFLHARRGSPSDATATSLLSAFDTLVPKLPHHDVDFCLRIAEGAIKEFKPECVVSQGTGSWMAWKLAERGGWTGPSVWIDPAIVAVEQEMAEKRSPRLAATKPPGTGHGHSHGSDGFKPPKVPGTFAGPLAILHTPQAHNTLAESHSLAATAPSSCIVKVIKGDGAKGELEDWVEWTAKLGDGPIAGRSAA